MLQPIPAIDIIDGHCVRLTKGDYSTQKVYESDPLAAVQKFEQLGFKRLHLVDLDGARSQHVVNLDTLCRIAQNTHVVIDFGGGIKTDEDLQAVFDNGAQMATIGTIAISNPLLFNRWLKRFGSERLILGADVKEGKVSINGWKEDSQTTLFDFLDHYTGQGVTKVLCTDISRDGMLEGPASELYKNIMQRYPTLQLIASGGISSIDDLERLDHYGIPAAVFGKAIYEGRIDLEEVAQRFLQNHQES